MTTMTRWSAGGPDGAEVCEQRPTVLIDHGGEPDHKFWRWELRSLSLRRYGRAVWTGGGHSYGPCSCPLANQRHETSQLAQPTEHRT